MFKRFFLTTLLTCISAFTFTSCTEDDDPLELTIDLPLNETMAWQGAIVQSDQDSSTIMSLFYHELRLTETTVINDTVFYVGSMRAVETGWQEIDTTGTILISKTSLYLQQTFLPGYRVLLKQTTEQPAPATVRRLQRLLVPIHVREGARQQVVQPAGAGWDGSSVVINPLGKRSIGPYTGMGVLVDFRLLDMQFSHQRYWLLDEKGKIWTLAVFGPFRVADSVGNETRTVDLLETHHRIKPESDPVGYLRTLTIRDFYLKPF